MAEVSDIETYPDGPIAQMMLGVVLARIRTSMERFNVMPTETAFPEYIRTALYAELPFHAHTNEHLKILGVRITWIPEL